MSHMSHVTCLGLRNESRHMSHVSHVTCLTWVMSHESCHMSPVSHVTYLKWRLPVTEGTWPSSRVSKVRTLLSHHAPYVCTVCLSARVCECVCVCVFVCARVCQWLYIYTHTHTLFYPTMPLYNARHVGVYVCVCARARVRGWMWVSVYHIRVYIYSSIPLSSLRVHSVCV